MQLRDGRQVDGASLRQARAGVPSDAFVLYLLGRRPRGDVSEGRRWVQWRDFGTPASTEDALDALREAHRRAADGPVLIVCCGGVGRTGTALAVLLLMEGASVDEAVDRVRREHHPRAVETRGQRRWLHEVAARL